MKPIVNVSVVERCGERMSEYVQKISKQEVTRCKERRTRRAKQRLVQVLLKEAERKTRQDIERLGTILACEARASNKMCNQQRSCAGRLTQAIEIECATRGFQMEHSDRTRASANSTKTWSSILKHVESTCRVRQSSGMLKNPSPRLFRIFSTLLSPHNTVRPELRVAVQKSLEILALAVFVFAQAQFSHRIRCL